MTVDKIIEDENNKEDTINDEELEELVKKIESGEYKDTLPIIKKYEEETGKYAIWRGVVTEGFKKWLKGEKIYDRDKERISLYISEEAKEEWQEFIKEHNYSTISKLIRESVNYFIDNKSNIFSDNLLKLDFETLSNISHALKEPLTTIKGFSQLLLENSNDELNPEIKSKIESIFEQSLLLESKIKSILDDISINPSLYDILLIEDDVATIRLLTNYFENKGYKCKGVISGTKAIEELKHYEPKLILLDIILPDLSGYDLCKMIHTNKKTKHIPIYLLTAIPESEVRKKLKETLADGFILKPFDLIDFNPLFKFLE